MAEWNKKNVIFNRRGEEKGFTWNSKEYVNLKRINEIISFTEKVSEFIAFFLLSDNNFNLSENIKHSAFYDNIIESYTLSDEEVSISILFNIADSFGVKDDFTDFIVMAFLDEKFNILDDLKIFALLLANEDINISEIVSLKALLDFMDEFGFNELRQEIEAFIESHDEFAITDHDLRQAESDFLIGAIEDDDKAYDWFLPFGLKVDHRNTKLQVMPEAENVEIEMPGCDGSIIAGTTYKNRLFEIVAFSKDGLTVQEKEDLKSRITDILDSTKYKSKKLTVQAANTVFDVKYTGEAKIESGPSFVKMTADFLTPPYGKSLFPYELYGSGLVDNTNGDAPLGPIFTIKGSITNPSFKLGAFSFSWNGTIPENISLIIDFEKLTVYLKDNMGAKTNALSKFNGDFIKIDAGKSMVLVADENTESHILTEWSTPVLW